MRSRSGLQLKAAPSIRGLGSLTVQLRRGGRPESAFQGLKATSSPGSCMLYSHRRVSPISRFAANRDPDSRSRPNRETGVPDSRFRPSRESGIPFPVSRPNRESGERELGISGSGPGLEKANKAMLSPRPKLGWLRPLGPLRTHRALRIGASATFPAGLQRPQGPLCDRTLLTRSFVIAPARLLSRHARYGTCAPRALAVAMLGPHHGAPSPRARCQGGPQRRPSL